MSVKAMSLVWDMECPTTINEIEFKPGHKYTLVAYADHADHNGKNIYPAVATIARKTGYEERSVQRLTHELENMGILVEDGQGPRGTNKWFIPFSDGGDKISPLKKFQGDKDAKSLGDIPSGDIPSGDNLTPEFKELNQADIDNIYILFKEGIQTKIKRAEFLTWVEPTRAAYYDGRTLTIAAHNDYARRWLEENITQAAQQLTGIYVKFVVFQEAEET